jgi:flagellar export protein FliJ
MPPYRLQTLLEIREREEEAAKQAFSLAMQEAARERAVQAQMEQDLVTRKAERKAKVQAHMQEVMSKGAGISALATMNRYENRLKDEEAQLALEIERQKDVVRDAERVVEKRRFEMAEAAKELKAIEKHKEKWAQQVRAERQAREDLSQEEIGNALHLARMRAKETP